ncbi:MAG: hypothetical protein R2731_05505 [Nocardioides sp.]
MLHGWLFGNGGDADARSVGVDPGRLAEETVAQAGRLARGRQPSPTSSRALR